MLITKIRTRLLLLPQLQWLCFKNYNNSSYSFPNPSSNTFSSLPPRPDYGSIGFSNNGSSNLMHNNQHYHSFNHQFLMNGPTMPYLSHTNANPSRFNPNLAAENPNKPNTKLPKINQTAVQPVAAAAVAFKKTSSKSKESSNSSHLLYQSQLP